MSDILTNAVPYDGDAAKEDVQVKDADDDEDGVNGGPTTGSVTETSGGLSFVVDDDDGVEGGKCCG